MSTASPASAFSRRRLLTGAAAAGAALAGGLAPRRQVRAQSGRPVIYVGTLSSAYREGLERLAQEYMDRHPEVQVKIEIKPANGYETWLRTQILGAEASGPDVYNANFAWGLYEQGKVVNLTPYVERINPYTGRPWRETLNEQFLEKLKIGGDVAIIPLDFIEIAFYYNQDLFRRYGLTPPASWAEMLRQAEVLQAAGVMPFAIPGNADSYWSGTVGWIARFMSDAYMRKWVPQVVAKPGDWNFDPRYNTDWRQDMTDPFDDSMVVLSSERQYQLIRSGRIRFDGPEFARVYTHLRNFSHYWQRGYHGANATTAYTLFLTQRAAMLLDTSAQVSNLLIDMDDLPAEARFNWDLFPIPPLHDPVMPIPPFRGVGGAGTMFAIAKKNPEQTARVVDFLMFVASPHGARVLVEEAVKHEQPLTGPMLIEGADLPPEVAGYFDVFGNRGFEKLAFRGLGDEQESVWEWTVWAQRYMEGLIDLDTFLERYQALMIRALPRVIERFNHDLDPRTKDMIT